MKPLRIALTKGRLEKSAVVLLEKAGMECAALREKGRKLCFPVGDGALEAVLCKSTDVLTYVEHGVCDLGIVGKDAILERGGRFFEILDLGFGKCGFALAAPRGKDFFGGLDRRVVASKYPNVTKRYFESKAMDVEIIKIEGSVELAPLLGLADGIVDIVETGSTLRENGLEIVERVTDISARLVVNPAAMKLRKREIEELAEKLEQSREEMI